MLKKLSQSDFTFDYWKSDLIAGVTVGIVALPLALAFGITTGVGAGPGLVTAIIAGFLAALLGGSRFQVSGPTGAMTVVLVPIVANHGPSALVPVGVGAGIALVLASILKLGNLVSRIPWSVMEGFTLGIAMVIGLQQIPMALDIPKAHGTHTVSVAFNTLKNGIHRGLSFNAFVILFTSLLIKFATPHILKKMKIKFFIPGSFTTVVVMTIACWNISVPDVGSLPVGIFKFQMSELNKGEMGLLALSGAIIAIAALGGIESLLSARVADQMAHHRELSQMQPNHELFGQGIATIAASLFGGMPATGAIARTSVNVRAGGSTRLSAMIHAIFLLIIYFVLSPLIAHVPSGALAAILIGTSWKMANPREIIEQLRTTKTEAITFLATALSVLFIDLIWGIAIGIALHLLMTRVIKLK